MHSRNETSRLEIVSIEIHRLEFLHSFNRFACRDVSYACTENEPYTRDCSWNQLNFCVSANRRFHPFTVDGLIEINRIPRIRVADPLLWLTTTINAGRQVVHRVNWRVLDHGVRVYGGSTWCLRARSTSTRVLINGPDGCWRIVRASSSPSLCSFSSSNSRRRADIKISVPFQKKSDRLYCSRKHFQQVDVTSETYSTNCKSKSVNIIVVGWVDDRQSTSSVRFNCFVSVEQFCSSKCVSRSHG